MAVLKKTNITMGEILVLERSFNDELEMSEIEAMEMRLLQKVFFSFKSVTELIIVSDNF